MSLNITFKNAYVFYNGIKPALWLRWGKTAGPLVLRWIIFVTLNE